MVDRLLVHDTVTDNSDISVSLDAVEAFGLGKQEVIEKFLREINRKGAMQFLTISSISLSLFVIRNFAKAGKDAHTLLKNAVELVKETGKPVADKYGVNACQLNNEVDIYLRSTLLPIVNGISGLELNSPSKQSSEAMKVHGLAVLFVTHAIVNELSQLSELGFGETIYEIRCEVPYDKDAQPKRTEVPKFSEDESHFSDVKRSIYTSPLSEALSAVNLDVPMLLADAYDSGNSAAFRDFASTDDISPIIHSTIHFCRLALILTASLVDISERNDYVMTARKNVSVATDNGSLGRVFGIDAAMEASTTLFLLESLDSLNNNLGVLYEAEQPEFSMDLAPEVNYSISVGLGMLASSYRAILLGKLNMTEESIKEELTLALETLKK